MPDRRHPIAPSHGTDFNTLLVGDRRRGRLPKYVFVLSLENRSFDHLFGLSGITGKDPETGRVRPVNGVLDQRGGIDASWANAYAGETYPVATGAPFVMTGDPKHEFEHILCQTCGPDACAKLMRALKAAPPSYRGKLPAGFFEQLAPPPQQSAPTGGGPFPLRPAPDNSGFVHSYVRSYTENAKEKGSDVPQAAARCPDPQAVMRCFDPRADLPNLFRLASTYVLCDSFFSSLPGPTAPNRFFMMSGSAAGYDASPSGVDMQLWTTVEHVPVPANVFTELKNHDVPFQVFGDDTFPMAGLMEGVHCFNTAPLRTGADIETAIDSLEGRLARATERNPYPFAFTWIEPDYDVASSLLRHAMFSTGNSMHPCSDVRRADQLIADVYGWISGNPSVWNDCVLFITWDEHGGFYDHVLSPTARAPDATGGRTWSFGFDRFGARIPCLVISPLLERNLVDGRQYDHASILRTVVDLHAAGAFTKGKPPSPSMTAWNDRIRAAVSMLPLFTQAAPQGARASAEPLPSAPETGGARAPLQPPDPAELSDAPISGNTPSFVFAAMCLHKSADPDFDMAATARKIQTDRDAALYLVEAERVIRERRAPRVA